MLVHKKNLITSATKAYEDSILETVNGKVFVGKDDYVITNYDGDQFSVSEEYIQEMKQVEITHKKKKKMNSPFVEQYMKELQQMSELQQEESKEYIEGKQNGWSYKDALNETYNG